MNFTANMKRTICIILSLIFLSGYGARGLCFAADVNYKFDGHYLRNKSGIRIAEVDGKNLRDDKGRSVGVVDGKYIRDSQGNRIAEYDGQYIRDASGKRIGNIKDVNKDINGVGGITLVALWLLFVR